jgi:hypothetical protein
VSDEAVERYLAALRAHVDPDPAFRRRLRGAVLNRYVAGRQPLDGSVPRAMGQLGRAVLYASFALAVSVTGVMAASEVAVPGDALYPLKRAIEELRVEVLPARFRDDLAVYELNERLSELVILSERGDERVAQLAQQVAAEYAPVLSDGVADAGPRDRRSEVLASLISRLPDEAQAAIGHALLAPSGTSGRPDAGSRAASEGEKPGPAHDHGPAAPGGGTENGNGHGSGNGQSTGGSAPSTSGTDVHPSQEAGEPEADESVDDTGLSQTASPTPKPSPGTKSKATPKP